MTGADADTRPPRGQAPGEAGLLAAIIDMAWHHAMSDRVVPYYTSSAPRRQDQAEARLFLTAARGEWAEAREVLCDLVGLDPDMLRQAALRRLEERRA